MNPGWELGDCKTPVRWVIKGKHMLALRRRVCQGLLINTSRNTINQQLAPLYVCPGSKESHRLWERGLNGGGEDMGGIFKLGCGRAPDNDQVALWSPPGGGNLDIGVMGCCDKGIVAD